MKVLGIARSGERFRTRTFSEKLTLVAVGNETVPLIFYQAPKLPKMLPKFYTSLFINVDELLGRHVSGSTHDHATQAFAQHCRRILERHMRRTGVQSFRRSKVEHFDLAFWRDLHIRRLQVSMNDTLLMGCFECFTNVLGNLESFFNRNRTALNQLRERFAFDELEHEESCAVRVL